MDSLCSEPVETVLLLTRFFLSLLSSLLVSTLASADILATWDIKRLGLKVAEFKFDDVTSRPTSSQVR